MTETIRTAVEEKVEALLGLLPEIVAAVLVLALFIAIGAAIAAGLGRALRATGRADRYVRLSRRLVRWLVGGLGLVLALQILGLTAMAASLIATGGIAAIVFGFAFREIGENLLAGIFLAVSRSFEVGDLIESSDLRGVVRDIDLRQVHIRTADGRDIFIPSAQIFKNPLVNFTRDHLRRAEFTVGIDYRDDPEAARKLLAATVASHEGVLDRPSPAIQLESFSPTTVDLGVYFWVRTDRSDLVDTRSAVMAACRRALADEGFTFASEIRTGVDLSPVSVDIAGDASGALDPAD